MDALHADSFLDIDIEEDAESYGQEPESYCTAPRESCTRCQELGRRCRRCRLRINLGRDRVASTKSPLELTLGSGTSRRRHSIEETPSEPTRITQDTPTRTGSEEPLHDTRSICSERMYTPHATYRSGHDSSSSSTSRSERSSATRRRRSSYTHTRSRHSYYRDSEEIPDGPTYYRSDAQFEVIETSIGWQLLSTKCHVEKFMNGRSIHYHEHRHFAEPFTDHSHCRTCRRLHTEDIVFQNVNVTYIKKTPLRGCAEEVWSAMIGKPLPMRRSVIRSTWRHSGPLRVRRGQKFGPGRLLDHVHDPSEPVLILKSIVKYLYEAGKSVYYALRYYIFDIYPAGDRSHEID